MIPESLATWLEKERGQRIIEQIPVAGGCINHGQLIITDSGESYFLKSNTNAPPAMFEAEVHGLELMISAKGPRIPKPIHHAEEYLLMEDLSPGKKDSKWAEKLGRGLAKLHTSISQEFGLDRDNFIGSTPQINNYSSDGYEFFATQRLAFQTRLARDAELLSPSESGQIDRLSGRLEDLIPRQAPALLHGDLWSGNAIWDAKGEPALIDPAVYYGWPEADLAMTALFGAFGDDFYRAYTEEHILEKGWRDRFPIYNLYHLLNHLNLFGNSYHEQVMAIVRQY